MKQANCLHCRKPFQQKIFNYRYCESNPECKEAGNEAKNALIKKAMEKARAKTKIKTKEETKFLREKLKTLSDWKNDLQKEINAIVREIDKGHPCIATGATSGKMNAGHYIGVGANDTLRFHLENIWIQSEHSNMWKSGDTLRYQDGIISLYGKEYLESLNSLKTIQPIKLSIDEIKEKIPICRGILKWLKLQDRMFTNQERLELRKEFNEKINIYDPA